MTGRALWAPVLLALALGAVGLTWGLPARWHPDEKADVAARMVQERSLHPGSFINPSLPLYAMLPAVALQSALAGAGLLKGVAADPLLLARLASVLAAAAAVLVLGWAVRATHPALGATPALALALAPGFVNLAHFATPEAWLLLGSAATLGLALRHLEQRAPAWSVGLALGLAASTKYTAAALLLPVLAALWLRPEEAREQPAGGLCTAAGALALALGVAAAWNDVPLAARLGLKDARLLHPEHALRFVRGLAAATVFAGLALLGAGLGARGLLGPRAAAWGRRLARPAVLAALGAAALGFLAGTPYALLDPQAFVSDLAYNQQTRVEYKGLTGEATSYAAYLALLADAFTAPGLLLALLGAVVAAARALRGERASLLVLLAFAGPYLLVASSGHRALRFLAAAFPAAAWLLALGLTVIASPRLRAAGTALVLGRLALASVLVARLFLVDSRVLAERWLERHVPPGATIDLIANHAGYAPHIPQGRHLRLVPTLSREMAPAARFQEAAGRYAAEASPWLVLTASYYERFLEHPDQQPERAAFFRDLLEGRGGFEVAARFRQQGWLRPEAEFVDPEIVVLRRRR